MLAVCVACLALIGFCAAQQQQPNPPEWPESVKIFRQSPGDTSASKGFRNLNTSDHARLSLHRIDSRRPRLRAHPIDRKRGLPHERRPDTAVERPLVRGALCVLLPQGKIRSRRAGGVSSTIRVPLSPVHCILPPTSSPEVETCAAVPLAPPPID